ncbi:uncharacterized protein MONOS_18054 [Monocercomonoides exilis]|uniref:uncharacterized protein n=1 Tax=Monocercomonoides exilis TaxID=2049356 RepID=UPI00355A9768|nr:hypothetical protein MONOS_18054 [Monocercomonoides exilis]
MKGPFYVNLDEKIIRSKESFIASDSKDIPLKQNYFSESKNISENAKDKKSLPETKELFDDPLHFGISSNTRHHFFELMLQESRRIFNGDIEMAVMEAHHLEDTLYARHSSDTPYIGECVKALSILKGQQSISHQQNKK